MRSTAEHGTHSSQGESLSHKQDTQKFLKKYTECGTIGRKEAQVEKTAVVRRLVDENITEDAETTVKTQEIAC